jgi:periplasmic divalent cation tolerance protein
VLCTAPPDKAPYLARSLVEDRLAACVSIVPAVRSIYTWQGKVEDEGEALLLIKTTALLMDRLTARIKTLHPYTVPEVVGLALTSEGNADYLRWLSESVDEPSGALPM